MANKDTQQVLRDLAEIQRLSRELWENSGIPVVESCARWCENYSQLARWSLGEGERFAFMDHEGSK